MRWITLTAALVLARMSSAFAAESYTEAADAIAAAWEKVEALEADMHVNATAPAGEETLQLSGGGKLYYLKDGGTPKYRQEFTLQLPEPHAGVSKHTAIFDGESLYLSNELMGHREVQKVDLDISSGAAPPGGRPLLDALEESLDMTRRPDTELEGTPVYVLEGRPRDAAKAPFNSIRLYIDKDYGVQRKVEISNEADRPAMTVTWTTLRRDVAVDPALFEVNDAAAGNEQDGADEGDETEASKE